MRWARGSAWTSHIRRWVFVAVGLVSVALGAIGAVVPGLPTTVFLLIASYCFARSCPWMEDRFLRIRFFAPYLQWIDGRQPMSRAAKAAALTTMWVAVAVSFVVLRNRGLLPLWAAMLLLTAAAVGTVAIVADLVTRFRAAAPEPD